MNLFIRTLLFSLAICIPSWSETLLFEEEIETAVEQRDAFLETVGLTLSEIRNMSDKDRFSAYKHFTRLAPPETPWHELVSGLLCTQAKHQERHTFFSRAIAAVKHDPGKLWVLFCSLYSTGDYGEAEQCLYLLEHYTLQHGISSIPVIAQQLLMMEHKKKESNSISLVTWSKRFDSTPFWQTFYEVDTVPAGRIMSSIFTAKKCYELISQSWILQINAARHLYRLFRMTYILVLVVFLCALYWDSFPFFMHAIAELFPTMIPLRLRFVLLSILLASFSIFGFIPFLFAVTAALYRYVPDHKKWLYKICIVLIALTPVDSRVRELFRDTCSENSTCGLYSQARSEPWSPALSEKIEALVNASQDDHLGYLASALVSFKRLDMETALSSIEKAAARSPQDPVVLTMAGIIAAYADTITSAKKYFYQQIRQHPSDAVALFNAGQLNLTSLNLVEGSEQISKASALDQNRIPEFMKKNVYYFGNHWPILRQYIIPDYTPAQFWFSVIPGHCGSWHGAALLWGKSFWGLQPLHSCLLMMAICLLIWILPNKKVKMRKMVCTICGSPLCRKCRNGTLCTGCFSKTTAMHNKSLTDRLQARIAQRSHMRKSIIILILNILFPKIQSLCMGPQVTFRTICIVTASAWINALYITYATITFSYPFWTTKRLFIILFLLTLPYSLISGSATVSRFIKERSKRK